MVLLKSLFINAISFLIAFAVIRLLIMKNKEPYHFVDYFNLYGLTSFLLVCFYLKYLNDLTILMEIIAFFILFLFYLRSFDAATKKYHERFKITILSFGYSKKTYFNNFLSKKILMRGVEAFLFAVSFYYFMDKLFLSVPIILNPVIIIIPSILLFFTTIVKSSKINKTYRILK